MAISLVGWATASGDNDTNATLNWNALTDGSGSAPSPGDYTIVFGAASSGVDSDVTISDGTYAAIGADIYQSDSFKVNTNVFAKVQGATPDASVSINGSNNNTGGNSAVGIVLRGVDAATQLDVAIVQGGLLNTALANAPAVTPITAGAWIIAGGGIAQDLTPGTFTGPANMTDYHQASAVGSSRGNVTWAAIKTDWTSGAFDPDPLTGGDESTSYAYGAFTIVVRPAASSSIDIAGAAAAATSGGIDLAAGGSLDVAGAAAPAAEGAIELVDPAASGIDVGGMAAAATAGAYDLIAAGVIDIAAAAAAVTMGDLSLPPSGVSQPLALTPMPFDGYVFDSPDGATAPVTISGQGTTGDTIQARGASAGGNTAWASTVVDVAGNWTVTFDLDAAQWGNWYTPEARIGTDDLTKISDAATFGCGHVIVIFGQSEPEYILATASAYNQLPYPALDAQNLTMITQANSGSITPLRIAATGVNIVNVAMVAISNVLKYMRDGRKLMICDACVSGESRIALANDANPGRDWATQFQAMINLIRSGGSDVGAFVECYYNADAATIDEFLAEWAPFYFGQRSGGGAFTLGTPNPDSTRNPSANIDHCLWDITAASDQRGRGIFARDRTKLHIMTPMPFHDTLTTEQRNFNHDSTGALINNRIQQLDRPARDAVIAFAADSRVLTFLGSVGPSAHVVDFGGGIHPLTDSEWGTPQFAMTFLPSILRATGMTVGEPRYIGYEVAPDGSYVDRIYDLPNGGNLTTLRLLEGLAAPSVEPPHYQEVGGYEIRRAADADSARRPVMKLSETGYPANYRGTVTIVDPGTGTAPSRTGRVRITPEVVFAAGDRIEYLRGEANGHLVDPRDVDAQLFLDQLIEHVPGWYDPAALYPMRGIPVQPQPAIMTISLAPAIVIGGMAAGAATGDIGLEAGGVIDIAAAAASMAMGDMELSPVGAISISGAAAAIVMGALDFPPPGTAPRRAAYVQGSATGGTIRAAYG